MKARAKIGTYIILTSFLLVALSEIITFFYFQEYRILTLSILSFFVGVLNAYTGFKQMQIIKTTNGVPQRWWNNYGIIMGLFWMLLGVLEYTGGWLYTANKFFANQLDTPLGTILGILLLIFTVGLGIYGIALTLQYYAKNRKAQQS